MIASHIIGSAYAQAKTKTCHSYSTLRDVAGGPQGLIARGPQKTRWSAITSRFAE